LNQPNGRLKNDFFNRLILNFAHHSRKIVDDYDYRNLDYD